MNPCCSNVELAPAFASPRDYEATITHIQSLLQTGNFELVGGNCPIGAHFNENGCWRDDILWHSIRCKTCGRVYTCWVDTYHGHGKFFFGAKTETD